MSGPLIQSYSEVLPFLKWAGGKRWLVDSDFQIVPRKYGRYIEPFLGSAAVLFSTDCTSGILSDSNNDLITTYKAIQEDWRSVERKLKSHAAQHSDEYYYSVRASRPKTQYSRAARFIYLNRTCWNGLYRVNLKGEFNVPRGSKNTVILGADHFSGVSKRLSGFNICCCDFEETIELAKKGDFIFIDPPYTVKHNENGFVKYNEKIFHWGDQLRLRNSVEKALNKGVKMTISNADHSSIKELYGELGEMVTLYRQSVIAGSALARGKTSEILIRIGWEI